MAIKKATKKAAKPAAKKTPPPNPAPTKSPILTAVEKALASQAQFVALEVIVALANAAKGNAAVLTFLDAAYQQVKAGGGSDAGGNADPFPGFEKSN